MSDPVHVVGVLNEPTGLEALYVGGDLKDTDFTLHLCDVARVSEGKVINFSFLVVEMPDGMEFPETFPSLVQYIKDESVEAKADHAGEIMKDAAASASAEVADEPMTKGYLLEWLREDFEDNLDTGGSTWWLKDLAERLEVSAQSLVDRDHDTGLLFELEQEGHLSYSWLERNKGEFDYLIGLNGGRIEWD
jgi:hypothetical protein